MFLFFLFLFSLYFFCSAFLCFYHERKGKGKRSKKKIRKFVTGGGGISSTGTSAATTTAVNTAITAFRLERSYKRDILCVYWYCLFIIFIRLPQTY